jgi:hypothetical protein
MDPKGIIIFRWLPKDGKLLLNSGANFYEITMRLKEQVLEGQRN